MKTPTENSRPGRASPRTAGKTHLEYLLTAYLFESISEEGRREVEGHLEVCGACRRELDELRGTLGLVRESAPPKSDGTSGDTLDEQRLQRILATRPQEGAIAWMLHHRRKLAYAAAAVFLIGVGGLQFLSMSLSSRMAGREYSSYYAPGDSGANAEGEQVVFLDRSERSRGAEVDRITAGEAAGRLRELTGADGEPPPPETPAEPRLFRGDSNFSGGVSAEPAETAEPAPPPGDPGQTSLRWGAKTAGKGAPAAQTPPPGLELGSAERLPGKYKQVKENARWDEAAEGATALEFGKEAAEAETPDALRVEEFHYAQPGTRPPAKGAVSSRGTRSRSREPTTFRSIRRSADRGRTPSDSKPGSGATSRSFEMDDGLAGNVEKPVEQDLSTADFDGDGAGDDASGLATEDPIAVGGGQGGGAAGAYGNRWNKASGPEDRQSGRPADYAKLPESLEELQAESSDSGEQETDGRRVAASGLTRRTDLPQAAGQAQGRGEKRFSGLGATDSREGKGVTSAVVLGIKSEVEFEEERLGDLSDLESVPARTEVEKITNLRRKEQVKSEALAPGYEFRSRTPDTPAAEGTEPAAQLAAGLVAEKNDRDDAWMLFGGPDAVGVAGTHGAPLEVRGFQQDQNGNVTVVVTDGTSAVQGWSFSVNGDGNFQLVDIEQLASDQEVQGQSLVDNYADHFDVAIASNEEGQVPVLGGKPALGRLFVARAGAAEHRLRAYDYYRRLDPELSLESFGARKLSVPSPAVGDEGLGREEFRRRYGVNPFVDTLRDHFSTFGMDVDTASYTFIRNLLRSGKLPDSDAVRTEEWVNYFRGVHQADPDNAFSVFADGGPSPFGKDLELLKITVKAREVRPGERRPLVLTFAVDTSGSMATPVSTEAAQRGVRQGDISAESRLALVRHALRTLSEALEPQDRVALVAYSTHPYLVLPHTPAREISRVLGAIDSLQPTGATNVEAGVDLAYRIADEVFEPKAVNRVVLCSDGVANLGARGPEEILQKVQVFARRGIYLSCVGFGMGRYNDRMLETLADQGNGKYTYVDTAAEAEKLFRDDLSSTLDVLAQDAKIQVDFNSEVVSHYRLLGYENRDIRDQDFRNDKVDAGEVGPGSTVTVLYEIRRRANPRGDLGKIYLRYLDTASRKVEETNYPLSPGVLATELSESSERFRFIAAVAETAELLRDSYWARDGSYGKVLQLLGTLSEEFRSRPEVREFTEVVLRAQALTVQRLSTR